MSSLRPAASTCNLLYRAFCPFILTRACFLSLLLVWHARRIIIEIQKKVPLSLAAIHFDVYTQTPIASPIFSAYFAFYYCNTNTTLTTSIILCSNWCFGTSLIKRATTLAVKGFPRPFHVYILLKIQAS